MTDIVFLYDQVTECIARLHAFSAVKPGTLPNASDIEDEIDNVAELLAKRDLLMLAASTRNFAEACSSVRLLRARSVPLCTLVVPPAAPFFVETSKRITLYQALSRLLHSTEIQICRMQGDYESLVVSSRDALIGLIVDRMGKPEVKSEPLIIVSTEQEPLSMFTPQALVTPICDFLSEASDDLRATARIHLPRDYR